MISNSDITIYNQYYDYDLDKHVYQGTVIKKIYWSGVEGFIRRTGNSIVSSDKFRVMIPFSSESTRAYIDPVSFSQLADKSGHFTIESECLIVRGVHEPTLESLADLGGHNTVTSVDLKDYGSESMQHWDVIAK